MRTIVTLFIMALSVAAWGQTLEECRLAAERNYPLIRRYDLIARTADLTVENISRGRLPQIAATAQATLQSDVAAWPDQMRSMYEQMGLDMRGLSKLQYRVGVDVSQSVYDGGDISSRREQARRRADVEAAGTEVTLYDVGRRVNEMYFALLLLDERLKLNSDLRTLLAGSEAKLASMVKGGTAAESDLSNVRAELLAATQQQTDLESQRAVLLRLLSAFCGIEVTAASRPPLVQPSSVTGPRPELKAVDARLRLIDADERALDAALRPRVGLFATAWYGYPGYNMFKDMMSRRLTLNAMVGVKVTWNVGALYTRRADKARLQLQRDMAAVDRDVFLFNNRLEQTQQLADVERCRRMAEADAEIIELRAAVRKAAESKLAHGIIDVNDLLSEINRENAARVQRSIHEIEMLKAAYDHKLTACN